MTDKATDAQFAEWCARHDMPHHSRAAFDDAASLHLLGRTAAGSGISDAQIAALRDKHGITSSGRGIRAFDQIRNFVHAVLAMAPATTQAQEAPSEERAIVGYVVHDKKADMQDPANWIGRRIVSKFEASEYTSECVSPVYREVTAPPSAPGDEAQVLAFSVQEIADACQYAEIGDGQFESVLIALHDNRRAAREAMGGEA